MLLRIVPSLARSLAYLGLAFAASATAFLMTRRPEYPDPYPNLPKQPGEVRRMGFSNVPDDVWVECLAITPDGKQLLTGDSKAGLLHWDLVGGGAARTLAPAEGRSHAFMGLAVSADGRLALSATQNSPIRLWDLVDQKELRRFEVKRGGFTVALTGDGRRAAWTINTRSTAEGDPSDCGDLMFWDVVRWKPLWTLPQDTTVQALACSPDNQRVLVGYLNGLIRLLDSSDGHELRRYAGHLEGRDDVIRSVVFSADGKQFLSADQQGAIRLWDVESGKEIQTLEHDFPKGGFLFDAKMSADARYAMSSGDDGTARLWDLRTGRELHRIDLKQGRILCVAMSADGRRAAIAPTFGVFVWDLSPWLPKE